jgi:DNA-binding transcriptional ArsR family regulator
MICQGAYIEEIMKPIFHPSLDAITLEGIFHALSDPARTAIFANIAFSQCPQNCTAFAQISDRTIPKSTLSQHFNALREAGLIRSERQGVEVNNISRCEELEQRFPGLIPSILNAYKKQLQENAESDAAWVFFPGRRWRP